MYEIGDNFTQRSTTNPDKNIPYNIQYKLTCDPAVNPKLEHLFLLYSPNEQPLLGEELLNVYVSTSVFKRDLWEDLKDRSKSKETRSTKLNEFLDVFGLGSKIEIDLGFPREKFPTNYKVTGTRFPTTKPSILVVKLTSLGDLKHHLEVDYDYMLKNMYQL